jgi:1,2-diacylglycerol 3-alpha-glucosyltransferase
MNVVALTTFAGPYTSARYVEFAASLPQYRLSLIEMGNKSETYNWKYSSQDVPYNRVVLSSHAAESQPWLTLGRLLFRKLNLLRPDLLVICGYGVPGMLQALIWARLHGKHTVLLSDSKEDDARRIRWREAIKSLIVRRYDAALVAGQPHKRYLEKLGKASEAIFFNYDVVDNAYYHPDRIRHLPVLIPRSYFLVVSRFVPKKNLSFLISAYAAYRNKAGASAWDLVICGDGELRQQIERLIHEHELLGVVHLPGFLQQEELLPYFAHAGSLIHASSQEQWGLVVNEAMAAGLPVLVSRRCGCYEDLIINGETGFGFDPEDIRELSELMFSMSSGKVDLETIGKSALEHIQKFSLNEFVKGLSKAIEYARMGK